MKCPRGSNSSTKNRRFLMKLFLSQRYHIFFLTIIYMFKKHKIFSIALLFLDEISILFYFTHFLHKIFFSMHIYFSPFRYVSVIKIRITIWSIIKVNTENNVVSKYLLYYTKTWNLLNICHQCIKDKFLVHFLADHRTADRVIVYTNSNQHCILLGAHSVHQL